MLQTFKSKVTSKSLVDSNVVLLRLELINPKEIEFEAGQYVLINVPKTDGAIALKHFSIASTPPEKNYIDIVAKLIHRGIASTYIDKLKIGDEVIFSGPAGVFKMHESDRNKIFIATGTGIAPIKSIIMTNYQIPNSNQISNSNVQLFWGLQHFKDIYFFKEFIQFAEQNPNFEFKICLSQEPDLTQMTPQDQKYFSSGRVTDSIFHLSPSTFQNHDFYVCGGRDAVESIRQYLYGKEVPHDQVVFEKF